MRGQALRVGSAAPGIVKLGWAEMLAKVGQGARCGDAGTGAVASAGAVGSAARSGMANASKRRKFAWHSPALAVAFKPQSDRSGG
jgi:hypothetical protein